MRGSKSIDQIPQSGIVTLAKKGRDVVAEVDQEEDLGRLDDKAHPPDISATPLLLGYDALLDKPIPPNVPAKSTT